MLAKIRCAEADECGEITGFNSGCPEVMALSIFQDIKNFSGEDRFLKPLPSTPWPAGSPAGLFRAATQRAGTFAKLPI
jgi:hypothetical protein